MGVEVMEKEHKNEDDAFDDHKIDYDEELAEATIEMAIISCIILILYDVVSMRRQITF